MSKRSKARAIDAKLDELYATLPTIQCRGLCGAACGPIMMTEGEADRIRRALHETPRTLARAVDLKNARVEIEGMQCSLLDRHGRCRAYAVRPFICRAWGLAKRMSCFVGCVPDRWLGDHDFARIAMAIERASGELLGTTTEGLAPYGDSFLKLEPHLGDVSPETADRLAELTRGARALHRGVIVGIAPTATGSDPGWVNVDELRRKRRGP